MGREAEAELHFQRAMSLAPGDAQPYSYYARWLKEKGGNAEALIRVKTALKLNPSQRDAQALARSLQESTAESYLDLSLRYHQERRFEDSIRAAREALKLKPITRRRTTIWHLRICINGTTLFKRPSQALRINPAFTLAKNNLAYSAAQKDRE